MTLTITSLSIAMTIEKHSSVYPILLGERLPPIAIPLLPGDESVTLDLQAVFDRCFDAGPYCARSVMERTRSFPPLDPDQAAWASELVEIWSKVG